MTKPRNDFYVSRAFIIDELGRQQEYSIPTNKITHEFGRGFTKTTSLATTSDNKIQFECNERSKFKAFDLSTYEEVSTILIDCAKFCVVTPDNEFIISADDKLNSTITKFSTKTNEQVSKWSTDAHKCVTGLKCSNDSKYLFTTYLNVFSGFLGISDIHRSQQLMNIRVLPNNIQTLAFTKNGLGLYLSDLEGNVNLIKWKKDKIGKHSLRFNQNLTKVGKYHTFATCLTKNERHMIVSSDKKLKVFNTRSGKLVTTRNMSSHVISMSLNREGSLAILAEENGNVSYFDLKSYKNYVTFKCNQKDGKFLKSFTMM